jgi:hypothetical protein
MSLNLGGAAVEAMRQLGNNPDWKHVREGVLEQSRMKMNTALELAGHGRDDACGYARALRDLYIAFESATLGVPVAQVKKPGMQKD